MSKKEKKQYEKDRFHLLGGKAEKNEKMPYWLLMRRARRTHNREEKEAQEVCINVVERYIKFMQYLR